LRFLPLWLAPTQLRLLPVLPAALPYCHEVAEQARREYHLRVMMIVIGTIWID
jgi:threonyl-tRNA synthetase